MKNWIATVQNIWCMTKIVPKAVKRMKYWMTLMTTQILPDDDVSDDFNISTDDNDNNPNSTFNVAETLFIMAKKSF